MAETVEGDHWEVLPRFAGEFSPADLPPIQAAIAARGAMPGVAMLEEGIEARSVRLSVVVVAPSPGVAVDRAIEAVKVACSGAGYSLGPLREVEVRPAFVDPRAT
jgi:hypothetical protein